MTIDDIVFKSGHYRKVPAELAQSFLDAELYEDEPNRMFKRRWSNPAEEMPEDHVHFFSVAYHNDEPVAVAYGNIQEDYSVYEMPNGDHFATARSNLGVYVLLPRYRGIGMARAMVTTVLRKMLETRTSEPVGTRMTTNARRFCAHMINDVGMHHKFWITNDDMKVILDQNDAA